MSISLHTETTSNLTNLPAQRCRKLPQTRLLLASISAPELSKNRYQSWSTFTVSAKSFIAPVVTTLMPHGNSPALFADVSQSAMYVCYRQGPVTIISKYKYLLYLNKLFKLNILQLICCFLSHMATLQLFFVHDDVCLSAKFQARGCIGVEPLNFHLLTN